MSYRHLLTSTGAATLVALTTSLPAQAVVFHTGSGAIQGSLCVGFDCPSSPSFDDATILLMENNTRIKFGDTSSIAGFPNTDWELEANSQSSGGPNRFSIFDCGTSSNQGGCGGSNVFSVSAGAGNNAIFVDSGGRVGFGTGTPVLELHVRDGDTPSLRLEQDNSNGFTPQTWDVAGNEAGFFIRDATGGSTLPFRIRTGGAPSSSIDIESDGDVRIGHSSSTSFQADIRQTSGTEVLKLSTTSGGAILQMDAGNNGNFWNMTAATGDSQINFNRNDGDPSEMILDIDGNLTITGEITTSGSCSIGCDRVFDADYDLPSIEEHAALMWTQKHLPNVGPTPESGEINVSDKVLRMLNELEHAHIYIAELHARLEVLEAALAAR